MNYDAQLTLLSAYTDSLNEGADHAERFLWRQGPLAPDLLLLLALARRLSQVLAPLPLSEPFRSQLHQDLITRYKGAASPDDRHERRSVWFGLAAVGSLLPLVGIVVWRRHRRSQAFQYFPGNSSVGR